MCNPKMGTKKTISPSDINVHLRTNRQETLPERKGYIQSNRRAILRKSPTSYRIRTLVQKANRPQNFLGYVSTTIKCSSSVEDWNSEECGMLCGSGLTVNQEHMILSCSQRSTGRGDFFQKLGKG